MNDTLSLLSPNFTTIFTLLVAHLSMCYVVKVKKVKLIPILSREKKIKMKACIV